MMTRRDILLGLVAGAAGFGLVSGRAFAWYYEELTPDQAAAFASACRSAPASDNHADLLAGARQELAQRIAKGLLPPGSSEQVGCPVCGCTFTITADSSN